MPISFGVAIFFFVLAAVAALALFFVEDAEGRRGAIGFGLITVALGAIFTIVASANSVPVRNVGIVTSFNKPTGEVTGSGLKFVAPWKKINDWDASVQTADHSGNGCVTVRIGSLATACVENKVRWKVKPEAAPEQYMAFKGNFENMQKNLFETELQNALNEAFSDYNPLSSIDLATGQTKFDGTGLADEVRLLLQNRVGSQIEVEGVVIPLVKHDAKTEENIKSFQDVIAQNRILSQKQKNAEVEKATAALLQSLPPAYTVNKCLDVAKEMGREPGLCLSGATTIWQANK